MSVCCQNGRHPDVDQLNRDPHPPDGKQRAGFKVTGNISALLLSSQHLWHQERMRSSEELIITDNKSHIKQVSSERVRPAALKGSSNGSPDYGGQITSDRKHTNKTLPGLQGEIPTE